MPMHAFLCKELLACPSCMLDFTESCDLLSKSLFLLQQGGSWFPPQLSQSPWARKLPSQEVRDFFFGIHPARLLHLMIVWCFKKASHANNQYTGRDLRTLCFPCARGTMCMFGPLHQSVTTFIKMRPFGFTVLVCCWLLCVWCRHYAKVMEDELNVQTGLSALPKFEQSCFKVWKSCYFWKWKAGRGEIVFLGLL